MWEYFLAVWQPASGPSPISLTPIYWLARAMGNGGVGWSWTLRMIYDGAPVCVCVHDRVHHSKVHALEKMQCQHWVYIHSSWNYYNPCDGHSETGGVWDCKGSHVLRIKANRILVEGHISMGIELIKLKINAIGLWRNGILRMVSLNLQSIMHGQTRSRPRICTLIS